MNSIYTPIRKDPFSKIEEEFDYEILKIGKFTKKPPLINHSIFMNHFKILFFLQGCCRVIVEDQEHRVGPGDLLVVPINAFYTVSSEGEETIEFFFLHFTVQPVHKIARFIESLELTQILVLHDTINEVLVHQLQHTIKKVNEQQPGYYLEAVLLLQSLMLRLRILRQEGDHQQSASPHVRSSEETVFNQCVRYLQEHLNENITVDKLCEIAHVSQSYLYRCFKKLVQQSPSQFILQFKLQKSQELLKTTDDSITAIADATGFSSIYLFCSTFKAALGLTPTQFRKHFKNQGSGG